MATISQEKDLEMLRKNADGTYTKYNPKTKANVVFTKDGKTVEESLVNLETELGTNKATLLTNITGIREVL